MASGIATITDNQDQTRLITVGPMTTATGTSPSIALGPCQSVSVALEGTFAAATFVINGSNDGGTTWFPLKDLAGSAFSFTANAMDFFGPAVPLLIQFSWSGGAGGTAVTAYIGLQKNYF